mmetsp:Transcript_160/g.568  ORF Transcript_160/g.568 Transcript_160/m.568 type:complete len:229 (+) Transcript_160:252-938(+)
MTQSPATTTTQSPATTTQSPMQPTATPAPNNNNNDNPGGPGNTQRQVEMGVMAVSFVPTINLQETNGSQDTLQQRFLDDLADYLLVELSKTFPSVLSIQLVAFPIAIVGNNAATILNVLPTATFVAPASTTQLYIIDVLTIAQQQATKAYIATQEEAAAAQQESWVEVLQSIDVEGPTPNGQASYNTNNNGSRELLELNDQYHHHPWLRSYTALAYRGHAQLLDNGSD